MFRQMSYYMDNILLKHQIGLRKRYNTHYHLLKMSGKWKSTVDKGKSFDALLVDLSKALIAKLYAYGFSPSPLKLVQLSEEQKIKN